MNNDLTFNSVVYKKSYDDKVGSLRQSNSRGVSLPSELTIQTAAYVDSQTKVPGTRYTVRFSDKSIGTDTVKVNETMQISIQIPSTVVGADHTRLLATLRAAVADSTFLEAVLNNER